jgi:hypothetical protein
MKTRSPIDDDLSNPNDDGFVLGSAGRDEDPNAGANYGIPQRHSDREISPTDRRGIPGYLPLGNPRSSGENSLQLEHEILSRLLAIHPGGLGKELMGTHRDNEILINAISNLQKRKLIYGVPLVAEYSVLAEGFCIKLTSAGIEEAKKLKSDERLP